MMHRRALALLVPVFLVCRPSPDPSDAPPAKAARSAEHRPEGVRCPGLGVPECEAYFMAVERCAKSDPGNLASIREATDGHCERWKKHAGTPAERDGLATACRNALDALKVSCP